MVLTRRSDGVESRNTPLVDKLLGLAQDTQTNTELMAYPNYCQAWTRKT